MPKFILPTGVERRYREADSFTQGYVEAMFFTIDEELSDMTVADLSPETWGVITGACAEFQRNNKELLEAAYSAGDYDATQAGRDFWFTRNGHGVGFWDRKELERADLGEKLSRVAHQWGEKDIYKGDDGQLYIA